MTEETLYDSAEIARACGVNVVTVHRACKSGDLVAEKRQGRHGALTWMATMEALLAWRLGPGWERLLDDHAADKTADEEAPAS